MKQTKTNADKTLFEKILIGLCVLCFAVAIICVCCIGFSRGLDGKSAYQIAVENGFEGTEEAWIASLAGKDGKDGVNGVNGKDGVDGKDGLDGKDGKDGVDGLNGKDGTNGANGKDGVDGKDGVNGANGENGVDGKDGKDGENGKDGKDGLNGKDGVNGKDGKDGKGIEHIALSEDGLSILITYTDQTTETLAIPVKVCEHSYIKIQMEEASCAKEGLDLVICEKCNTFYLEHIEINAETHNYEPTTVLPTCEEDGYISYTCSVCGDSYAEEANEENKLFATGHSGEDKAKLVITVEPGKNMCADGYERRYLCTYCMQYEYKNVFVKGGGHTVTDDWTVAVEPTAETVGELSGVCPVCGEYAKVEIPMVEEGTGENTGDDTPQTPNPFPGNWWDYKKENN